jgi:hypothetical protein
MYCCVDVVTLVRRTRRGVTLEVLAYLVVNAVVVNATLVFRDRNFCPRTQRACLPFSVTSEAYGIRYIELAASGRIS